MSKTATLNAKLDVAHDLIEVGTVFQHYKGGIYIVEGYVIDTDDGEVRVLYSRVDGPGYDFDAEQGIYFVRPFEEFAGLHEGKPRFQRVAVVITYEPLIDAEAISS